jgi:hypothetical protein
MLSKSWAAFFVAMPFTVGAADIQWSLQQATLTYRVSNPLHQVEGVSHAARGKGLCQAGQCSFLVAVPVKSFDSGDSNRDLHMIQDVRGGQFPMVTVRFHLSEAVISQPTIPVDLDVEFAGQTAHYKQAAFQKAMQGSDARISGTIPAKMSDFKIEPPSLLAIPTKDEIPVRVDMIWRPM